MRSLLLMTVALAALVAADVELYHSEKLENINVDEIISIKRLLVSHCKCVLEEGPCTEEGKEIKTIIPDAIGNDCGRCTPKMKVNLAKIIRALQNDHSELYAKIIHKFDPKAEKTENIKKFVDTYASA